MIRPSIAVINLWDLLDFARFGSKNFKSPEPQAYLTPKEMDYRSNLGQKENPNSFFLQNLGISMSNLGDIDTCSLEPSRIIYETTTRSVWILDGSTINCTICMQMKVFSGSHQKHENPGDDCYWVGGRFNAQQYNFMEESMDKMENIRTSPKESSRKDVNSKGIISPILLGEPLTTSDLPPIPIRYRMLLKNLVTCFKDSFLNQQSSVHQKIREHDLTFKWWSLKFWKKHGWIVFFLEPKALRIL